MSKQVERESKITCKAYHIRRGTKMNRKDETSSWTHLVDSKRIIR